MHSNEDWGSHHDSGSHEHGSHSDEDCSRSGEHGHGSHESGEHDEGAIAGMIFLVFIVVLAVLVTVGIVITCYLKKRNRRHASVVDLSAVTGVKAAPAASPQAGPLPEKTLKHFEVLTITPRSADPSAPQVTVTVAPPAYTSTVDLSAVQQQDPRDTLTMTSPPPAYDKF